MRRGTPEVLTAFRFRLCYERIMGALTYEHSVNHDAYELNMHNILSYNVAGSKVDNLGNPSS